MNLNDWITNPFSTLLDLWESFQEGLQQILAFMTQSISFDWYHDLPDWIKAILTVILGPGLNATPEGNVSILSLVLGGAIGTFLILTIIKWIIGIVT